MTGAPWVVAVNPTAGGGRGARWGRRTVTALRDRGHEVRVVVGTTAADAERRAARAVAAGARALVVVGGDGMVHLGVNVAASAQVSLGVVPAGSGNDFARALGLGGLDPASAVAVMVRADEVGGVDVDLGLVDGPVDGRSQDRGTSAASCRPASTPPSTPGRTGCTGQAAAQSTPSPCSPSSEPSGRSL